MGRLGKMEIRLVAGVHPGMYVWIEEVYVIRLGLDPKSKSTKRPTIVNHHCPNTFLCIVAVVVVDAAAAAVAVDGR